MTVILQLLACMLVPDCQQQQQQQQAGLNLTWLT
jgi:hypothetical protein